MATKAAQAHEHGDNLSWATKFIYGFPSIGLSGIGIVVATTLLTIYTQRGVSASFIAIVQFAAGLAASYLQLALGYAGDRTNSKFGRRRPYILFGLPGTLIAVVALYAPGLFHIHNISYSAWFAIWYTIYVVFREFVSVPLSALGVELTQDDYHRKSLFTLNSLLGILGLMLFSVMGLILPKPLEVFLAAILAAVSLLLLVWWVRENPEFFSSESMPLIPGIRMCMQNHQWVVYACSVTCVSLINEIVGIYQYLLTYVYLVDAQKNIGIVIMPYILSQLFCVPLGFILLRKVGKIWTFRIGAFLVILYGIVSFFLTDPGLGASFYPFLGGVALMGCGLAFINITTPILQSDVIDLDELRTGDRREGTYQAVTNLPSLFFSTAGKALPLMVLAAIGFKSGSHAEQSDAVKYAIRAMVTIFPGVVVAIALVIFWHYRLDEKKHKEIRDGIEAFKRGEVPIDPFTDLPVVRPRNVAKAVSNDRAAPVMDMPSEKHGVATYLMYFSRRELRAMGDRMRKRVVARSVASIVLWCIDVGLCVAGAVRLMKLQDKESTFMVLTLAAIMSVALFYEVCRISGMVWLLGHTKDDVQTYVRLYKRTYRRQSMAVRPSRGGLALRQRDSGGSQHSSGSNAKLPSVSEAAVALTLGMAGAGGSGDKDSLTTPMISGSSDSTTDQRFQVSAIGRFALLHVFAAGLSIAACIIAFTRPVLTVSN